MRNGPDRAVSRPGGVSFRMFPFLEVLRAIVAQLPLIMIDPVYAAIFWVVVFLVASQYRRIARTEAAIYAAPRISTLRRTAWAAFQGILAGIAGSLVMVFFGVTLSGSGIIYVLPVALLLLLISPRLMCFSYAGAIVSLTALLTGLVEVNVAGIMALVAILHMVESLLILFSGAQGALPMFYRLRDGRVAGGFNLQRFWPVPIVVLALLDVPGALEGAISMPDWWPLISPGGRELAADTVFSMIPVMAVLGYGDVALTALPTHKSRWTAGLLFVYSAALLGLSLLAESAVAWQYVAALFAAGGHEAVARWGSGRELAGRPLFVSPARGVMVLDVWPRSAAARMGVLRGDVIVGAAGRPVNSRRELDEALMESGGEVELLIDRDGGRIELRSRRRPTTGRWGGLVLVPEPGDPAFARPQTGQQGFLLRLLRRLFSRLGGRGGRRESP